MTPIGRDGTQCLRRINISSSLEHMAEKINTQNRQVPEYCEGVWSEGGLPWRYKGECVCVRVCVCVCA